jgi:hypothetical protein
MVSILTPVPVAIKQAMGRARESRRFPHPTFLPLSHKGFRENLIPLSGFFDEAIVFAKDDSGADTPSVIAEKRGGEKELVIHSESRFSSLLQETI